ncbi:FUSC family protein [Deinococcus sonorensis]|uniref:FUSC family protein n=2 Tax=Deinococcus sonorensis TaxID=309891 RepID=A0AAU7UBJ9_9DEIO
MLNRRTLILRAALRLNWTQFRPWLAFRSALGVAIPILLGAATGHPTWGVVAALGALMAGMASFHGAYRARARLMLTVSAAMALAAGLGTVLAEQFLLPVLAVALMSLVLARYTATAVGANTVIIQAFTMQTLLLGFPNPGLGPFGTAGLVLAGGLIQTLLLVMVWPASPRRAERNAVAAAYDSLARFVASLASGSGSRLPGVLPFQNARVILADAHRLGARREHLTLLQALRQGEGLHAALVGFAQADALVRQTGAVGEAQANAALKLLEDLLGTVVQQLRAGHPPGLPPNRLNDFERAVVAMEDQLPETSRAAHQAYAHWTRIMLLHLQFLRPSGAPAAGTGSERLAPVQVPSPALRPVLQGHLVRFTGAMTLATLAERLLHIPNGFWIPLTVCLVLRPEFSVTVHRGVTRIAGTGVGVVLAMSIMLVLHPAGLALSGLLIMAAWLSYALFLTNYAVFSAAITVYIILSLSAAGLSGPVADLSAQRLLATLLGGVIAMGSYLVWPTWHAPHLWDVLLEAVKAQQGYAEGLARWMGGTVAEPVEEQRGHARRWRLRADELLQSALVEPHWAGTLPRPLAQQLLTRLNANAAELLAIQAQVEAGAVLRPDKLHNELTGCLGETAELHATLGQYSPGPTQDGQAGSMGTQPPG